MTIIVFGGSGFIGSRFINLWASRKDTKIINVDKLTYAANQDYLHEVNNSDKYTFYHEDITNKKQINEIVDKHQPTIFINFAAESHVDNSIKASEQFIITNVVGTHVLLEIYRQYCNSRAGTKFIQISTDEVFGDLKPYDQPFCEQSKYDPRNPYSASKASSDHLVLSYINTYALPLLLTNCTNNYGPNQYEEKLIPKTIKSIMKGDKITIYGKGDNIRDWIYVDDHCDALIKIIESENMHNRYNIGSQNEVDNLSIVKMICNKLSKLEISLPKDPLSLISFVDDRLGHDKRYSIDNTRITEEYKWQPTTSFDNGIDKTIEYYVKSLLYK